jgi:glycogen synthase
VRVLMLSWEYPPMVEGGLARHVRKLSERLVAGRVEVDAFIARGERMNADMLAAARALDGGFDLATRMTCTRRGATSRSTQCRR